MTKQREPLPGQRELPFGKKAKSAPRQAPKPSKYDPLLERPITTCAMAAYEIITEDGEHYIELWSYGSTISEAHEHFKQQHPEHPKFTMAVIGVGEFRVDQTEHAFFPDARMLDQDGYIVVRTDGRARP